MKAMICGSTALLALFASNPALSQTATEAEAARPQSVSEQGGEIIVTGTRSTGRLVTDSPAPVDVISGETLTSRGGDLATALQQVAPSFNFPKTAIAASSTGIWAANLRGLGPDQTLVLVNGKRWHASSLLNTNGVVGRGTVPFDINAIPVNAIERIEVLRDGAAAQYGSDAIAGVVNITLKSGAGGGLLLAQGGFTSRGDGLNGSAAFNHGFALPGGGSLNVTLEGRYRDRTNRAEVDSRFGRVTNLLGEPQQSDLTTALNLVMPIGEIELYGSFVADRRRVTTNGLYRLPTVSPTLFPMGFVPFVDVRLLDLGGTLGVRGEFGEWKWDLSTTPGYNKTDFVSRNTVNTSLVGSTQTRFDGGGMRYMQHVINATLSRPLGWLAGGNFAAGSEARFENFQIRDAEPNAYTGSGAQSFQGFHPTQPVDVNRHSISGFVDVELSPVEALTLGAAARYENYSDFGEALLGKGSVFFRPIELIGLRGTYSTGFRAPSLQQSFYNAVTSTSVANQLVNTGTFAVNDPVAKALGATPLRPEKSKSLSAGIVLTPAPRLTISADYFDINVSDRIVLSENFTGAAVVAILRAAGVTNASGARFFTNAVDTNTKGFEITADYRGSVGELDYRITGGFAKVTTKITTLRPNTVLPTLPLLSLSSIDYLTKAYPANKATFGLQADWKIFHTTVDFSRYGTRTYIPGGTTEQTFSPDLQIDVTFSVDPSPAMRLTFGVLNVTDEFSDEIADYRLRDGGSNRFGEYGSVGNTGTQFFMRLTHKL